MFGRVALFTGVLLVLIVGPSGAAPRRPSRQATAPVRRTLPQTEDIMTDLLDRLWVRGDWYWHEGRYEERVALDLLIIRMQPRFIEAYGTAGWSLKLLERIRRH